jgi:ABC-2 type transport system permease protein
LRNIYLVARREYLAYIGAWGFWLSLVTTPLLLLAMVFAPTVLRRAEPTRLIAVIADHAEDAAAVRAAFDQDSRDTARAALWAYAQRAAPARAAQALAAFDNDRQTTRAAESARAALGAAGAAFRPPAPRYRFVEAPARDLRGLAPYLTGARTIQSAPLFAALRIAGEGGNTKLQYWSTNLTDAEAAERARAALQERMRSEALAAHGLGPQDVSRIESLGPAFAQFDPRAAQAGAVTSSDRAPFVAAIVLAFVLWSAVIGVANMLLTGVIEEKSNKILDALLTSLTPLQILCGKLLGVALVSATLFLVWGVFAAAAFSGGDVGGAAAGVAAAALSPSLALTFLACFAAGYLLYGGVFLGLGSLCDSLQEAQSLLGPVFLLLTGPILLLGPAFSNPKAPMIEAASWIPLFAPFVIMMRAPASGAAELAGPIAVLVLSVMVVVTLAARVFRAGVSHEWSFADLRRRLARQPR